jgi:hypothetical protein
MKTVMSPQSDDGALPIDTQASRVHPDDVGALFGQFATMRDREPLDPEDAEQWHEALTRALTGQSGRGTS